MRDRAGARGVRRDGAGHRGDPPVRDARRRDRACTAATTAAPTTGWEANDAFPADVRRRRLRRPVARVPRPAVVRPRPDRRRRHGLRRGLRAVHDVYIHRPAAVVRRPPTSRARPARRRPRRCTTASAARPTGCSCRSCRGHVRAQGVRPASGSRPSHVPSWRRARSGRTAPRRTTARRACGARRRGGAAGWRRPSSPSRPRHRLNVPSRPTGSSPTPAAASSPGARAARR